MIKTYAKSILLPLLVGGFVGIIIAPSMNYLILEKPYCMDYFIYFDGDIIWDAKSEKLD